MKTTLTTCCSMLSFFILLFILVAGCEKKEGVSISSNEDLPVCRIDVIKSCEAESSTETQTVYRCPTCGTLGQCPDCRDDDCKTCSDQTCRCRIMSHSKPRT